jgi:hypothetical protein
MKKQLTLALLALSYICTLTLNYANAQISFNTLTNYPINSECNHLSVGDFNNDGKNDVAVASVSGIDSSDNKLYVFLQDSVGSLLPPVTYDYIPNLYPGILGMTSGDINADGLTDIVAGIHDSIIIFYQNNTGTLDSGFYRLSTNSPAIIYVNDMNGDGNTDIAGFSDIYANFNIYYTDSFGQLAPAPQSSFWVGGTLGQAIGFGKILSDTAQIFRVFKNGNNVYVTVLHVALNHYLTFPNYTISASVDSSADIKGVTVGDLDNNGSDEIVILTDSMSQYPKVQSWDTLPQQYPTTSTNIPHSAQAIKVRDLDGDGIDEIIVVDGGMDSVTVISQTYGAQSFYLPCPNIEKQDGFEIVDVNNDGRLDIVSVNGTTGLSVLLNTTPNGIASLELKTNNVDIYPNPTTGKINLELKGITEKDYRFSVQSLLGQEIFKQKITSEKESFFIPVNSPGVYIGTVSDDNQIIQRTKIVFLK